MPSMIRGAGDLRDLVQFQVRQPADDGFGNTLPGAGGFESQFTASANLHPLHGSEAVQASRLQGRQPFVLTIRQSEAARQVNEAWRAVDARNSSRVFAIVAPPTDPDGRRAYFEILVVEGGET